MIKKKNIKSVKTETLVIAGIIFLFCIYGISLSIRNIRSLAVNNESSIPPIAIQPEQTPIQPKIIYQLPEPEYIEVQNTPSQFPWESVDQQEQIEDYQFEPQIEVIANEFGWNLTEEQQARMQDGLQQIQSMMQIWQNMTPEESAQIQSTFQEMGQRFQNMTPEERQNTFQQFGQQLQMWMQADQSQIPNFFFQ